MRTIAILLAAASLTACSPYINIPAQSGDVASHNPNNPTARKVYVAAITYLAHLNDQYAAYSFALPAGADHYTYRWVIQQLPAGADPAYTTGGTFTPLYAVATLYVRGSDAQTDIIITDTDRQRRLVSIYCTLGVDGWYAVRQRAWQVPVDDALRSAYPDKNIPIGSNNPEPDNPASPAK
jgi:hypothetical protein